MKKRKARLKMVVQSPRGNRDNAYARARMKAGLTQEEASQKLYIDKKIISYIENDKYNPTPNIALAMARLYGDDRLPRKLCREVCAIGRARVVPFDFNLKVVIPMMVRRFDEVQGVLNQLPFLLGDKESIQDFSPSEWELLTEYVSRIRKFSRDVEILEVSIDRFVEKAEKKTAIAAKRKKYLFDKGIVPWLSLLVQCRILEVRKLVWRRLQLRLNKIF